MSGGVVCYIERTPGGGGIRRLRLVAAGLSRQWTAPEPRSVSSVDAGPGGAPASVNTARAGATWIAETLEAVGLRRLAAVCVDAEGSICAWLSAPSPEPAVVRATIANSGHDTDGSGAGVGAARLIAGAESGSGALLSETSVQALATLEPSDSSGGLSFRKGAPSAPARKQRYAVLAVQDSVVRVLLDELDARSIEIERVVSIWHAMASGWDRAVPGSISDRLLSSGSPGGAVILIEPAGRLVWAWTRAGELIAGGAMRLAAHSRPVEPPAPSPASEDDSALMSSDASGAARRIPPARSFDAADEPAGPGVTLEFSTAEAGRLAVDWLSWSAQIGHCPQRVVCLSSPAVSDGALGPEALFAHLAKCWPGATIDGAVHDDPIGATIGRLAGLGPETPLPADQNAAGAILPYHARPREALTDLSRRPGRADRRLHQWIGLALVAAACTVAALGFQIWRSVGAADDELAKAKTATKAAIDQAALISPTINQPGGKPEDLLATAINKLREQAKLLKPPRPIIQEAVRVLVALDEVNAGLAAAAPPAPPSAPAASGASPVGEDGGVPGSAATLPTSATPPPPSTPAASSGKILLTELEFSVIGAKAVLSVPDATTGPAVLDKILKSSGVLVWQGTTPSSSFSSAPGGAGRTYLLTAAWPEDAPAKPATPPAGSPKRP